MGLYGTSHHVLETGVVGRFVEALFACVMVYMCILCFSFLDCSRSDGRELSGAGGGEGTEEELSVGELIVSNL